MLNFLYINPFLGYSIGVILCSCIMWLLVRFCINGCKFSVSRRLILLGVTFSILLPLLKIGIIEIPITVTNDTLDIENYEVLSSQNLVEEEHFWTTQKILLASYLLVSAILLSRTFISLFRIREFHKNGETELNGSVKVITSNSISSPFSFFKTIYLPKTTNIQGREMILRHENEHIRLHHTYDNLFVEFICSLFWFNPIFHLLKFAIKEVHEFEADEAVVASGFDRNSYKQLIFDQITGFSPEIANGFVFSLTKKRIIMLTKNQKQGWIRSLAILPAIASSMAMVSFTEKPIYVEPTPQSKISEPVADSTQYFNKVTFFIVDGVESSSIDTKTLTPDKIESLTVITNPNALLLYGEKAKNGAVIIKTKSNKNNITVKWHNQDGVEIAPLETTTEITYQNSKDDVLLDAQNTALYDGQNGPEAFAKWCQMNVTYPKSAANDESQGKVVVSFVLNKDASLSDIKVARSSGIESLDQEALRVVKEAPNKWTAAENDGKKVNVKILTPIIFRLQ